ncbi:metallophosphoesterase [Phycicoccus sonneratiae]|uniref:Metallophosphoesterase n=1 Tax=Phycicoccus sonneratiae TaxID=2807628 RepID=A0ABS2CKB1_9MICO|nr:metallophosphoesterase [Phycicoccus sonneraticus]MBM6400327.1 metallophosphoesterase [Phycicoccus sonneraticus]
MSALAALVPIGVFALFLLFVWHRLAVAPRWGRRWVPWTLAVLLLALLAAALEGFDVWGGAWSPETMRPVAWTGQAFLATCLYLFLGLVPVAVVSGLVALVRWWHERGREGRRRFNRVAAPLVALLAVGTTGYGAWEASHPSVTRFEVSSPELPAAFDGARVALVTDIHAGAVRSAAFTRGVVDLVNAQRPDLVVIAGDLEDGTAARYGPELAPLRDLRAPLGVFATTGNHEMFRDTANWVRAFEDLGITVLKNESVPLGRGGETITLAGVHDISGDGVFAPDPDAALAGVDPAGFTLYAAHQPRQARDVEGRGVDLQLSGHTHGGQMWPLRYLVPLQQPVVDGLHDVGDVPVLTSRGIGAWGPAIRVAAPPELPVVTLRRG